MVFNFGQLSNIFQLALVIPTGYVMLARLEQLLNADDPIDFTLLGKSTLVIPVQPLNAESPILVKEFGKLSDVNPVQPLNAELPILVRLLLNPTDVNPVHP